MPARSTSTTFRVVEAIAELDAWLKEMNLYGINTDGSKRGDRDYYEVILFGWNTVLHRPDFRLVNLVDVGANCSAINIAKVLVWTVTVQLKLDPAKWFVSMSDNTNAMSGERDTKASEGGCFKQARQMLNRSECACMPRVPCCFHCIHLGWTHVRPVLMGGYDEKGVPVPIPGPKQREIFHVWNLLFDVYSEFGNDSVDYDEMKRELKEEKGTTHKDVEACCHKVAV